MGHEIDPDRAMSGVESTPRRVDWSPQHAARVLEVIDRAALFERISGEVLAPPERLTFHLVVLCRSGLGTHSVDGVPVPLEPGSVLHVQPGQISQWDVDAAYGAWLILAPEVSFTTARVVGPRVRTIGADAVRRVETLIDLVHHPLDLGDREREEEQALRHLLFSALDLLSPDPPLTGPYAEVYDRFLADLETHLDVRQSINDRAARLGYSARTLTRSTEAFTGNTAKHEADRRLALEARRLLAVPELTTTAVGASLGFSEPTNFAKFVRRVTGHPPAAWRRR